VILATRLPGRGVIVWSKRQHRSDRCRACGGAGRVLVAKSCTMTDPVIRWLDEEDAARHLGLRASAFRRWVKADTPSAPSFAFGPCSPRRDARVLDSHIEGGPASPSHREVVSAAAAPTRHGAASADQERQK
jgi:hypothetical protein